MAKSGTRRGLKLSYWAKKGLYYKRIGTVQSDTKRSEKKFYLGSDRNEAELRALNILQLWERSNIYGTWTGNGLTVAQAIAKGQSEVRIKNHPMPNIVRDPYDHDQFDYEFYVAPYLNPRFPI